MRSLTAFLVLVIIFCSASERALANRRVALVIGNSSYQNVPSLPNPANDAAAVTDMFKAAGFDIVESRRDLKNAELRRVLNNFFDSARDADFAVVYYAGHGIEIEGSNYIVPVDALLERDRDVYDETISLDRVVQSIEPARQLRLVILDACRENPFAQKHEAHARHARNYSGLGARGSHDAEYTDRVCGEGRINGRGRER